MYQVISQIYQLDDDCETKINVFFIFPFINCKRPTVLAENLQRISTMSNKRFLSEYIHCIVKKKEQNGL